MRGRGEGHDQDVAMDIHMRVLVQVYRRAAQRPRRLQRGEGRLVRVRVRGWG